MSVPPRGSQSSVRAVAATALKASESLSFQATLRSVASALRGAALAPRRTRCALAQGDRQREPSPFLPLPSSFLPLSSFLPSSFLPSSFLPLPSSFRAPASGAITSSGGGGGGVAGCAEGVSLGIGWRKPR